MFVHHISYRDDDDDDVSSVRNKDLTWPEELCQLAKNKALIDKSQTGLIIINNSMNISFLKVVVEIKNGHYGDNTILTNLIKFR